MLRSTRRPARGLSAALTFIAATALVWPAGVAAAHVTTSTDAVSRQTQSKAPRPARAPKVVGQGVRRFDAGRGHGPTKPLETLSPHSGRPTASTGSVRGPLAAPVSVQATSSGAPAATSFGPWDGLDQASTGFEPPDPWVAAGPNDIVQTTNTTLRFRNREGTQTRADIGLFDFFDLSNFRVNNILTPINGIGDPRWIYDARHGRWVGLTLGWHCDQDGSSDGDSALGYLFGAISTSGDPTGGYYTFYVEYQGFLPDFPSIGTSADKFALSANEYVLTGAATGCTSGPSATFDGASMTIFDWAQMLTYPLLPDTLYHFSDTSFTFRPALQPQATSNTIYGVVESNPGASTSGVGYFTITGTNAANTIAVTTPATDLTVGSILPPFADPPQPIDPGGAGGANVIDRRPSDAIWQNNVLTFASTVGCDPVGGGGENRDCARVAQLNTITATPSRIQDMLIATTGKDTFYPGIGQSQSGTLHVIYTESSSGQGNSSFDRYQLPTDAVHTLSAAIETADGGANNYTGSRWGDFVGVAQDPRDTAAVWQGNQYTKSDHSWGTKVSEIQIEGSTFVPIDPVRLLDSRVANGLSGAFTANVARTVQITGRGGIPAGAVAITGNLTIANQTQAGYAALTPLPNNAPPTSTLNFPFGDNRANNITSPLSATGTVSIVYRAAPGSTAHFILDISGYFLNDDSGATYHTVAPLRVLDTRFGTGLTGAFPANTNRSFQVTNGTTIPNDATAVTGNLTVTNPTANGYVSLATNPPPVIPATSTINFPAGDRRANGLTIKLSATGGLSAVYKAGTGSTTDLIFDVTGYYKGDLSGARFVALSPGRRMDTRFAAPPQGLTGPFVGNLHRTLVIEPYEGVPVDAIAISGNLTVVTPSRAGYIAMTPDPDDNPPTSTINFPVNDNRANGVTGPLSAGGDISLVYRAGNASTHMILDLTGYFR